MIHARLTCSKNGGSCTCSCQLRLAASAVTSESLSFLFLAADNGHCNSQQQDLEYVTRSARHPRPGVLKSSIRNHNRHNSAIEETVNGLWQLSFEARSEIYPCDVFWGDQWRLAKFWNLKLLVCPGFGHIPQVGIFLTEKIVICTCTVSFFLKKSNRYCRKMP